LPLNAFGDRRWPLHLSGPYIAVPSAALLQRGCDAGMHCAKADQSTSDDPGTCRAFLAEGAACINDQDCGSGNCMDGACGGRPCLE
jgi:hypothetical protein